MARGTSEIRPTIDRVWLEAAAQRDPWLHAYALWDLEQYPDRVRFASVLRDGRTAGYLLVWGLGDGRSMVHWNAPAEFAELADHLPPRPAIVMAPPEAAPWVERARGPVRATSVLVQMAPRGVVTAPYGQDGSVRQLRSADRSALRTFAGTSEHRLARAYATIDPVREPVWAGFDGDRIVALARPGTRLPLIWVINGVYVADEFRNQGWGKAVVRAVMRAADAAGAPTGLYVREDGAAARAVYAALGFTTVARRLRLDAGTDPDA